MSLTLSWKDRKHQQIWIACCASLFSTTAKDMKQNDPKEFQMIYFWHLITCILFSERPRQLLGYDVCLRPSDNDWHIPLIVRTSAYSTRNRRTRGQDASKFEKPEVPWLPESILSASTTKPIPRLLARSRFSSLCSFIIVSRTTLGWLVWRMAITDTTVAKTNLQQKSPIQRLTWMFNFFSFYADTTVTEITLDFIQDCCITDNTVLFLLDLWSLTVHGALWMLELNVRLNSFLSMKFVCSILGLSLSGISVCS